MGESATGAILMRLFNEVWSNARVVGELLRAEGGLAFHGGAFAFTASVAAYVVRGRSVRLHLHRPTCNSAS